MWDRGSDPPAINDSLPSALISAFRERPAARDHYFSLKERHQKDYNLWINMARRPETVRRRVEEALDKLERGEELGLK